MLKAAALAIVVLALSVELSADAKFCNKVERDSNGDTLRSGAVLLAFKRAHPCPSTGLNSGPCSGWVMDHVIPLSCGGCDSVTNLQWLPVIAWKEKSKWERKVYGGNNLSKGCP